MAWARVVPPFRSPFFSRSTRRHWLPNVQRSHLWSDVFHRQLSLNVTAHALRQIDRVGGLDNYLRGTDNLESVLGQRIKVQLQRKLRATDARERRAEVSAIRTMYEAASPEQKAVIEATLRAAGAPTSAAQPQMR